MPVDLSKPASSRIRKPTRKENDTIELDSAHAREIELKRSRGEISCAECRRLKIRCDKTIPCQSCQRRGCAALCPNGSLATGQGTRFVLAATEHLHRRIAKMTERIRALEDALAIVQAKCSNEPHPLLSNELVATTTEQEADSPPEDMGPSNTPDVIDAFGTLSVSDHGVSRFFGPTGGTEYLLYTDSEASQASPSMSGGSLSSRDSMSPPQQGELTRFSAAFPFTPMGPTHAVRVHIERYLPNWDRARHLADTYLEHAAWLFRGVSRHQLLGEMLPTFYKRPKENISTADLFDYSGPHDLALLLLIFAVGALVDLNQEPYNAESEHYHQLARAALCLQSVLEKPSVVTIQALHLFSIYNAMSGNEVSGNETSMETSWSLVALAAQLSQSIGLHRDSARWRLPDRLVKLRRVLFWDLFVADSWNSLAAGRPPSFSREYIDCKFPQSEDSPMYEGEHESDFESWGFRFALQCVSEVAARTLTAEAPSYATIMELDRKVREFPIPPEALALLEDLEPTNSESLPLHAQMQRFVLSHSREVILLYIHRSFFAQAIIDHPTNPVRSAYAPSFLAAYRASCTILKAIREHFAVQPSICARFWSIWTFAFSAAVVFGTVVIRGPRSPLASAAISQLDLSLELFTNAAKHSRRASKALPILSKLHDKAHCAFSAAQNDNSGSTTPDGALWSIKSEGDEDELEIFAGRTKLVASKRPSPSPAAAPSHAPALHPEMSPYASAPPIPIPPTLLPMPVTGGSDSRWTQPTQPAYPPGYPAHHSQPHSQNTSQYRMQYEQQHQHQHQPQSQTPYPWTQEDVHVPVPPQQYAIPPYRGSEDYANQRGTMYPAAPSFQNAPHHAYQPPPELVDLGLASRDSRLDQRWTSFMHENGFLDGINYRS